MTTAPAYDAPAIRRCVVYVRISNDKLGQAAGVGRQRKACEEEAARRGWVVVDVVTDNDRSASEYAAKPRTGYAKVRAMVESGSVDTVLAWSADRLHRRTDELDGYIKATNGKAITCYVQGGVADYASAAGRLQARSAGMFGAYESEVRHERLVGVMAQNRELGRWPGRPAFGWTSEPAEVAPGKWVDRFTGRVDPVAGAAIRKACADLLTGVSLSAITREWTDAGYPRPRATDATWAVASVRSILRRASNAALVAHRGQVVGPGNWEAIVDESTWRKVDRLLANPARRTSTGTVNVHLGSGIYRCGVCGGKVKATAGVSGPQYKCPAGGHVTRLMAPIDTLVVDFAVEYLATVRPVRLRSVKADDPAVETDRLRAKLTDLATDFAEDAITRDAYVAARTIVQGKLDKLADLVAPDPARDLVLATGPLDAAGFNALPLASRRMILARILDVVVVPLVDGKRTPVEDQVKVTPKPL